VGFNGNEGVADKGMTKVDKRTLALKPIFDAALAAGVRGLIEMSAWLNERKIPSPRGGPWHAETVRRTQMRLHLMGHPGCAVRSRSQAMHDRWAAKFAKEAAARALLDKKRAKLRADGIIP